MDRLGTEKLFEESKFRRLKKIFNLKRPQVMNFEKLDWEFMDTVKIKGHHSSKACRGWI